MGHSHKTHKVYLVPRDHVTPHNYSGTTICESPGSELGFPRKKLSVRSMHSNSSVESSASSRDNFNSKHPVFVAARPPVVKKRKGAFIWPTGGAKSSRLGRMRDILSGRGPDIYVAFNDFGKAAGGLDGPSLGRWSGWTSLVDDPKTHWLDKHNHLGDVACCGYRDPEMRYDYFTRRYKTPRPGDVMEATFYTTPSGDKYLPSFAKHYRGRGHPPMHVQYAPWGGERYLDPRNFHDDFCGGIGGQGGWWNRYCPAEVDEWWERDAHNRPTHRGRRYR